MAGELPWADPVLHHPAIWHPAARREAWSVVLFRRRIVRAAPGRARVRISASQRYELMIDGAVVDRGPARSDPDRWCVREVALDLPAGGCWVAVRVHHAGAASAVAQMGPPGFLLIVPVAQADDLASDAGWSARIDRSRRPITRHCWGGQTPYYPVGPGERIDGARVPWGWATGEDDADAWRPAQVLAPEAADVWGNLPLGMRPQADPLPAMAEADLAWARVARAGRAIAADGLLDGRGAVVPAATRTRIVLDRGETTNAYLAVALAGGAGARIRLISAEAPYLDPRRKPHRDAAEGARFFGHRDEIRHAGGLRTYAPMWFRAFRYLVLDVQTAAAPLTIAGVGLRGTGFPLPPPSPIRGEVPRLEAVEAVSARTIRLCAHETIFDCPHYEQCQFPGDSRIQALYHYAVLGEDRLARKAIADFCASQRADGLIPCRWPSRNVQHIPTFGLPVVGMLDDLLHWRGHAAEVAAHLPVARRILGWFLDRRRADGLLGRIPHAPFMDWSPGFANGNVVQDADGGSVPISLDLALACRSLARLEAACGWPELAPRWQSAAAALVAAVRARAWDSAAGWFREVPGSPLASQHTQLLAVLAGAADPATAGPLPAFYRRIAAAAELIPIGTLYFRHTQFRAAAACGIAGEALAQELPRWHRALDLGLTTWPEMEQDPRSDCHGWAVSPAIALRSGVLGVAPLAPGMAEIAIAPQLGPIGRLQAVLPTPQGMLDVAAERTTAGCAVSVDSPVPVHLGGVRLAAGRHRVVLPS